MKTRCEKCASYYDIPWDIQRDSAIWLEASQGWSIEWVGDGLWKIVRKGSRDEKEKLNVIQKTFTVTEYLSPKTLVDSYRRLMDDYKKSRGYATDEEARDEKTKVRRGRKPKVAETGIRQEVLPKEQKEKTVTRMAVAKPKSGRERGKGETVAKRQPGKIRVLKTKKRLKT